MEEARIQEIVDRVLARIGAAVPETPMEAVKNPPPGYTPPAAPPPTAPTFARRREPSVPRGRRGVFPDVDGAVKAARRAFTENEAAPLEARRRWVEAMRETSRKHVSELSRYAVEETGYGRAEDKLKKNLLCINKTPGPEFLRPVAFSGDDGLTITERAPYGVIGAITPTTNPTETVINNAIGMISGGNAVVFNVHPYAARVSAWYVHLLNEAITGAGGPENLLSCTERPTIDSAQELMRHPGVRLLVVTGGPAVVKAAMDAGKKVIAAGPGNPPAVVDETADLEVAARHIVLGASIDNNIICTAEKEVLHQGSGGVHPNKDFIGKNAAVIAKQVGIRAGDELRLVMAEVDEAHPFVQLEMLMPVVPLVRAPDATEAIAMAKRVDRKSVV